MSEHSQYEFGIGDFRPLLDYIDGFLPKGEEKTIILRGLVFGLHKMAFDLKTLADRLDPPGGSIAQ